MAQIRGIRNLFNPADRVVAAFRATPEAVDALVRDLVEISMRKMDALGGELWGQEVAPFFGEMMRAVKAAQRLLPPRF